MKFAILLYFCSFFFYNTVKTNVQANGLVDEEAEVLTERGVETLPYGGKRLLTESNGQRIESFVQRLVASGRSSLPPSPCKNPAAVSPLSGR